MRPLYLLFYAAGLLIFYGCAGDIVSECDTTVHGSGLQANFSSIQENVFTPTCARSGCHAGPTPQQGMNLSAGQAYAHIVNVPSNESQLDRVEPGSSSQSWLVRKITADGTSVMPPSGRQSNAVIDSIRLWIDRGALDD